jgi:hypothetical protein
MTPTTPSEFIVMTSSAKVSGRAKQFGRYRNVAVLEIEPGTRPAMISERARGVRRIVWRSGAVSVGKTDKCAYARAQREAESLVATLQAEA